MAGHNGAMVAYDGKAPERPENRRPKGRAPPKEDDNVSEVSDAEYEPDAAEEPRFQYTTADLQESSWRNGTCCIITMCVLCVIIAIVVSVLMAKIQNDKGANDTDDAGSSNSTSSGPPGGQSNQNSLPGEGRFQSPKAFVNDRCSKTNFDRDLRTCQSVCSGFDCCDPFKPEEESCLFGNREGCLNYARCHALSFDFEPAPSNLDVICSPDRIAQDSSDCELQCFQMRCCYSDELSCVAESFYACLDYAPCQNLRDDARVPSADPTIHQFCDPNQAGSVSQRGACDEACSPAECCWSEGDDNCLQSDFFTCLTYEPCKKIEFPAAGSNVTAPSDQIGDACAIRNINLGQASECTAECAPGLCCAEDGPTNCFLADPLGCLQYDSCKVVN